MQVDGKPKELSVTRKLVLLVILCLAQFLDGFNNSSLYSAIPALDISMGLTGSESTWIISAFQLTFASFLLIVRVRPMNSDYISTYLLEWSYQRRI
jgi:MFS family permease